MERNKLYAIIRVRGSVNCPYDVEHTLKLLHLYKKYHCVVYPSNLPGLEEMLMKAKEWITWGEIDRDTLIDLLRARGKTPGDKRLTDEYVDKRLADLRVAGGIPALADAVLSGKLALHKLESVIKPVFRLRPPRGGFKGSVKKSYREGGETGYRGADIGELIKRMI